MVHRLYYSPRCQHSKKLFGTIQNNKLENEFMYVNVETTSLANLRGKVTSVPTIIDDAGAVHKGRDAFVMVEKLIMLGVDALPYDIGVGMATLQFSAVDGPGFAERADRYESFGEETAAPSVSAASAGSSMTGASGGKKSEAAIAAESDKIIQKLIQMRAQEVPMQPRRT